MVHLGPLNCGAWIDVSTADGRRRVCTLAAGHYIGPRPDTAPGMHPARNDESWHTDCPYTAGMDVPDPHACQHKNHERACMVWADHADGAHPSDVVLTEPATARCTANMCNNRDPHQHGDACGSWCPCRAHPSESVYEAASVIKDAVKESGRTLGTEVIGGYRADVKIADTSVSVYGSARFVARVITAAADAFEEEAER